MERKTEHVEPKVVEESAENPLISPNSIVVETQA